MQFDFMWKILSSWIIVFQFDGSFRPPRDPGYPTVTAKIATCAVCFYIESDINSRISDPVVVALGSRILPFAMDMTSAHAEYEGLLLGLDWLSQNAPAFLSSAFPDQQENLVVQGDCKTVIDQLSGKSTSRKLQKEHDQAMHFLTEIMPHFGTIDFVHIPRRHNALCDNLCSNTMLSLESFVYQQCCNELDDKTTSLESVFQKYIMSDTTLIRYSWQPYFLVSMLRLAEKRKDFESMTKIGLHVFEQAKRFTVDKKEEKYWKANGVTNQINGLRGMGQEKKATALERKHRVLLRSAKLDSLKNLEKPAEKPSHIWDSSIAENWEPLLEDWSQHATEERSWIHEGKGSSIWSQSKPKAMFLE